MFSDIMHGIMITMSPDCLLALCIGAMFGTVVGALPGLGTAVAITICIPFTLQMGNASAIALLLGVYATSIYGGSISAVLLNTPGTPQSACTGFEGYAMAKAGKAEKALGWITMASVLGGLFSCVALVIAAPQLADLSVKYGGPLEICGLICLGLACITSLSEDNQIKGLLMGVAGLFLATIGVDPLSGEMRFTFGSPQLVSGIDLMPIVVGVFPLAELFYRAYEVHANVEPTAIDCKRIRKAITPMSRAIHTSNMLLRGRYTPSREQMTMMLSRIAVGNLMSFPKPRTVMMAVGMIKRLARIRDRKVE